MQKPEMSSSSAPNDEKPGSNQSAFWWLIGLVTLLLSGSAWFAWKQPLNPDVNRTLTPGWIDNFRYPIEQNVFKRVTAINAHLQAVFALDQRVWVVGDQGLIVHSDDGGKTWERQTSGTDAWLDSITFHVNGQQGWAAGSGGTILKTADGGKSWQPVEYRIFPAPWFYVVLVLIVMLYAVAFVWRVRQICQAGKQTPVRSVSDHAATDKPVSLGDADYLGARRIAAGLTRFLTNAKTEPPLTLAITGDWGSGKSSLMNYLFAHLKRKGLKPVWFNAWHHREEQNVLASILAKVQQEAIKPWWHPAGFWFRGRLWSRRHVLWKVSLLLFLTVIAYLLTRAGATLGLDGGKWLEVGHYGLYLMKVEQPVILDEQGFHKLCSSRYAASQDDKPSDLCRRLETLRTDRRMAHNGLDCARDITQRSQEKSCYATPEVFLKNVEHGLAGKLLQSEEKAIRNVLEYLTPDTPVSVPAALAGWIAASIALLIFAASKGMALLGLSSLQLAQVVLKHTGVNRAGEKTGTRRLFESHFKHVTDLFGKRRLVLFIDDLDRCDRDYTRQVLEVTNFLSSSGALFIVIGMAPRYVLANVTLSFQDTAKAVHEADMRNGKTLPGHDPNAGQSWFAQHYLQKLINIEVPVPKPDAGQVKALLKNAQLALTKEDEDLEQEEKSEKRLDDALRLMWKTFQIAILLGAIVGAIYLAGWGSAEKPVLQSSPEKIQNPVTASVKPISAGEEEVKLPPEKDAPKPNGEKLGEEREEIFIPAPTKDNSFVIWPLWAGISATSFVMLLIAVAFLLIRKQDALNDRRWWWLKPLLKRLKVTAFGPDVTQDTKDFTVALDIWHELIARKDPTPRNIKAFINHLRYLASRDNQTLRNSREAHLVALATLYYVYPQGFDELAGHLTDPDLNLLSSKSKRIDLKNTLKKHRDAFGRLPSKDDIDFYRSMIQDVQIHRPD